MEFGKLHDLSNVDFSLPPDPPGNDALFKKLPKQAGQPTAYVGATGWGMKEWVGSVYPKEAKAKDYLYHYARQFNTIELNTTHYRIPDPKTIQKWYEQSAPDFHFCPKLLQTISHSNDLGFGAGLTIRFCEAVAGLKEKLGCCFIQLPPYFGADRLPVLEVFLKNFPSHVPLAVEVRHESWFNNELNFNNLFDLLENYGVASVITDVAGRRDVLHGRLTSGTVLIRFVGNGLHPTDFTRLDAWAKRLAAWFEKGLRNLYFFTHEPDNVLAPGLAVYFVRLLKKNGGISTRGPVLIEQNDVGKQMSLF